MRAGHVSLRPALALALVSFLPRQAPAQPASWYFAVSGDSRDCGDLVMPKIARMIETRRGQAPATFYWHLGDFRRMYETDCDILKKDNPAAGCKSPRPEGVPGSDAMGRYVDAAWDILWRASWRSRRPAGFLGSATTSSRRAHPRRLPAQVPALADASRSFQRQKDYPTAAAATRTTTSSAAAWISSRSTMPAVPSTRIRWSGSAGCSPPTPGTGCRAIAVGLHAAFLTANGAARHGPHLRRPLRQRGRLRHALSREERGDRRAAQEGVRLCEPLALNDSKIFETEEHADRCWRAGSSAPPARAVHEPISTATWRWKSNRRDARAALRGGRSRHAAQPRARPSR